MSAVLIDELAAAGPVMRPQLRLVSSVPTAVPPPVELRPAVPDSWHLTDRGIAVVLAGLVGLLVLSAVVLVSAFLSVPEAPVVTTDSVAVALR